MDIFEKASRLKLRFDTSQGQFSTEDLWELSLQTIDTIAKKVNTQLRSEGEETFLSTSINKRSTHNDLRLEILKHVIKAKEQEQEDSKARVEKRAKIARLKELAQQKADEALSSQSLDEINKQIDELELALV